jgi:uncharacterized protein YjbI with pentapeptide repeats
LALLFVLWLLWWRLPKWQVDRLALKIRDPKARADVEDNFRKTVGQALGGAAVLIGAGFALIQFLEQQKAGQEQQRTAQSQFLQQQKAAHDLLISNQVSKGFEQLAGEKIEMRLGGIYALEGVMNDQTSPQYHQPVLEALCAFVREKTASKDKATDASIIDKPATDVQAALTVIGRRIKGPGVVDLANVSIPEAHLERADLGDANLRGANLRGAGLNDANLSSAGLSGANLRNTFLSNAFLNEANLNSANLSGAYLFNTNLSGAVLLDANLSSAHLRGANLRGAGLNDANLSSANLRDANLSGADLSGAKLIGANLSGANLGGAELTQTQLDEACGDADTKPPEGLKPPKPCPAIPRQTVPPPRVP